MLALVFFSVPQPSMLDLFLPSEKQASGEPKHTPEREQAPCVCAWSHTKALQSLVRVKKCKAMSVHSASLQNGGTTVSSKGGTWDSMPLCNPVRRKERFGSHGIPTANTDFSKHKVTVCTLQTQLSSCFSGSLHDIH